MKKRKSNGKTGDQDLRHVQRQGRLLDVICIFVGPRLWSIYGWRLQTSLKVTMTSMTPMTSTMIGQIAQIVPILPSLLMNSTMKEAHHPAACRKKSKSWDSWDMLRLSMQRWSLFRCFTTDVSLWFLQVCATWSSEICIHVSSRFPCLDIFSHVRWNHPVLGGIDKNWWDHRLHVLAWTLKLWMLPAAHLNANGLALWADIFPMKPLLAQWSWKMSRHFNACQGYDMLRSCLVQRRDSRSTSWKSPLKPRRVHTQAEER